MTKNEPLSNQPFDKEAPAIYVILEDDKVCPICKGKGRIRLPVSECDSVTILKKDLDYLYDSGIKSIHDTEKFAKYTIELVNSIRKHKIKSDRVDEIMREIEIWLDEDESTTEV